MRLSCLKRSFYKIVIQIAFYQKKKNWGGSALFCPHKKLISFLKSKAPRTKKTNINSSFSNKKKFEGGGGCSSLTSPPILLIINWDLDLVEKSSQTEFHSFMSIRFWDKYVSRFFAQTDRQTFSIFSENHGKTEKISKFAKMATLNSVTNTKFSHYTITLKQKKKKKN